MSKSNDLLLCETIHNQLKKHERNEIISTIVGWLNILADGLDTDLSPQRALIISADILDVYAYDSYGNVSTNHLDIVVYDGINPTVVTTATK